MLVREPSARYRYPIMPSSHPTHAVNVFVEMVGACRRRIAMNPRSANDKEYFAQDWFIDRLNAVGVPSAQQGRNSYPDFWVGDTDLREGYEVKSLAFTHGRPARSDIDFNSTIPSGRKNGSDVFLVFFLYTGAGADARPVHSISLAHGDLLNADHGLADEHLNVAVHNFGSYADGFIRNRKMYVFPHPITTDTDGLGRMRLIVPQAWNIDDPRVRKVKTIQRSIAAESIDRYTIRLRGRGQAEVVTTPASNAGQQFAFDVFEVA